jgi:uncharacterized protein YqeY
MSSRKGREMLVDEIKAQMTRAMRARDQVTRNVLGVALGEIQTAEARANRPLQEDEATAILRKLVKSNEETLALSSDRAGADVLRREVEVLSALLPRTLSFEQIVEALSPVADAIRASKADGAAMGAAMKHLKASGAAVDAGDVRRAVQRLRG